MLSRSFAGGDGAPQNPSRVLPGDLRRYHHSARCIERCAFNLACKRCEVTTALLPGDILISYSLPGVLNLIFFHRYFPSIRPVTFDVLDLTLPAINDADLETLIESRVNALVRQHLSPAAGDQDGTVGGGGGGVRGRIAVEFYEKKRRRSGMWFGGLAGKGEEEVCWEMWTIDVTIATPRTESGMLLGMIYCLLEVPDVASVPGKVHFYIDHC